MKILITTSTFAEYDKSPLELLAREGHDVSLNPYGRKLKGPEVLRLGKDSEGIIAGTESLDADVLKGLKSLKVISRCGVGIDNVDLNAARMNKIKVFNTPYGPTIAVAELTVALILNLLRGVNRMDAEVKRGIWNKGMGSLLYEKKVGIIGFGRIGRKVGELLLPFGVEISYCDPPVESQSGFFKKKESKDILEWADIVTLHLSAKGGEGYIIGDKELGRMKKGSWIVNLSRGGVIDEEALFGRLKGGHLSGAALDVFEREPYDGRLRELDNVILTPHIGSYAKEARARMEFTAAENLIRGLKEKG